MNAPEPLFHPAVTATQASTALQTRIGFRLHPAMPWLVLPAGIAAQLAIEPMLALVPNVKPWLVGVLNLRGSLVPVFDVARWHGLPAPNAGGLSDGVQVLIVAPGPQAIALTCCEAPVLLAVRAAGDTPLDDPLIALAPRWFSAPEGHVYEFDPQAWLRGAGRQLPGRH